MKKLADNITFFLLSQNAIEKDDFEVYSYGTEYILSFGINMIGIFLIALITDSLPTTGGFVIGFLCMRSTSGGYHAETHAKCLIISYGVICLNIMVNLLCSRLQFININVLIIIVSILSTCIIFIFSPCDHANRPFSDQEFIKFKRQSRVLVIIGSQISILGNLIFEKYSMFFLSMCIGILIASVSVGIVKIKRRNSK